MIPPAASTRASACIASSADKDGKDSDAVAVGDSGLYPIYSRERGRIGSPVLVTALPLLAGTQRLGFDMASIRRSWISFEEIATYPSRAQTIQLDEQLVSPESTAVGIEHAHRRGLHMRGMLMAGALQRIPWLAPRSRRGLVIATVAGIFALVATSCKKPPAPTGSALRPIPPVGVTMVVQRDVPIYEEAVGTTVGFVNANILPKVSGYLLKQDYKDGARVHAGQLLFEIDDRPYQAALNQALGNLAQVQARLKQNQTTLERYTKLYKQAVIPAQTFDDMTQTTSASAGEVKADEAAVQNAKLNLEWCRVYSPIEGVAGIAQAQVGDLVGTSALLTTVSRIDPIKVSFPISEKLYLHFAGQLNALGEPNAKPSPRIELILDNGSAYSYPGRLYAVNRQVDVQTGTIMMQALFPNPENVLRPGMYAKVRAQTDVQHNALIVPQTAVSSIQGQYEVAVVNADNKVTLRPVIPGIKTGSLWAIDDGLKLGERVVADGAQKVQEGMEVKPVLATEQTPLMSGTPGAAPNPAVQE
jgi:membrane fusion protein (multidrug efflux system)